MISEAEITEKTGITYLKNDVQRKDTRGLPDSFLAKAINLLNPTFTIEGTGEDTRSWSPQPFEFSGNLLPCRLLATTTGSELVGIDIVVILEIACEGGVTDYSETLEFKKSAETSTHLKHQDQIPVSLDINPVAFQAERLREISGLKVGQLAKAFKVSRPTYHKWMAGSSLRDEHQDHLVEVLTLVEEANQRFGSPEATRMWLLTPVSPGGKKPIDYLAEREYSIFRGFLLRVPTGQEVFRSLAPSNRVHIERSQEEFEDVLERLRPRAWTDGEQDHDMDISDTDE